MLEVSTHWLATFFNSCVGKNLLHNTRKISKILNWFPTDLYAFMIFKPNIYGYIDMQNIITSIIVVGKILRFHISSWKY